MSCDRAALRTCSQPFAVGSLLVGRTMRQGESECVPTHARLPEAGSKSEPTTKARSVVDARVT